MASTSRGWFSSKKEREVKDNGDELNKWLENQAQTTKTILLHNQNIMQKLMSLQSSQLQLYEQNRALMSTVSDLCQIQKSLLENSSIQSGISKFSRPSADNAKLRIEAAHSFTCDKFASTFDTLRRTQVPPSHTLCFYYTSEKAADLIVETGVIPVVEECGGVPLSMVGPDDNEQDITSRWATRLALDAEEVVFVLAVPMRLLWAFPTSPDEGVSLASRLHGPFRVLPTRLINAASEGFRVPIRQIGKRAYSLVDRAKSGEESHSIPHELYDDQEMEPEEVYDDNYNNITSPRYTQVTSSVTAQSSFIRVSRIKSFSEYVEKVSEVRSYCVMEGSKIMLYHYTDIAHADSILSTGLRMSTQGQGDGGVYFSMLGPASYGFGADKVENINASIAELSVVDDEVDGTSVKEPPQDYEARLIIDCYGKERLDEYYGKNTLSLVLVCAVDEGILIPAPGGRDNALMVPKEIFETLGSPKEDGHFHLPVSCIRAALYLEKPKAPHSSPLLTASVSTFESFSSIRAPIFSSFAVDSNTDEVSAEITRDQQNVVRANNAMKKLQLLSGSNSLAPLPSTIPDIPSTFLPRTSIIENIKEVLLTNYSSQDMNNVVSQRPSSKASDGGTLVHKSSSHKFSNHKGRICVLQGMGGMGKSTIVASFAHDTEVRSAFDKIVWISVGQTPDIVALQESVHLQLTGEPIPSSVILLPPSIIAEQRKAALKIAALGSNVLFILDDVWEAAHEKDFSFLDWDAGSALLVSTRIRGLLKNNAVEIMAVALDEDAALSLLLAKSGIDEDYIDVESEEYKLAREVVSLTGCLPLTISIAAGLIEANGGELTSALVNMMKEDRLRSANNAEADESLEDRLITASLKMFDGRFEHLVSCCFLSFAAFPEDCTVPSVVFDVLAPYLVHEAAKKAGTQEEQKNILTLPIKPKLNAAQLWKHAAKKATTLNKNNSSQKLSVKGRDNSAQRRASLRNSNANHRDMLDVRKCLTDLVRVNLCSGNFSDGFNVHDIIRDYVQSRYGKEALGSFQQEVVNILLLCCSNEASFPQKVKNENKHSLSHYTHENLHWHIGEALKLGDDFQLPKHWINHPSFMMKKNLAMALGIQGINKIALHFENTDRYVDAAKILLLSKYISCRFSTREEYSSMLSQSSALLARAKDTTEFILEVDVILTNLIIEVDRPKLRELNTRLTFMIQEFKERPDSYEVNNNASFHAAWAETVVLFNANRFFTLPDGKVLTTEESVSNLVKSIKSAERAAIIAPNKTMFHYLTGFYSGSCFGFSLAVFSECKSDDFTNHIGTAENLKAALEAYQYDTWHPIFKTSAKFHDALMFAAFVPVIGYYHQCSEMLHIWKIKALNAFKSSIGKTNGLISHIWYEVYGCIVYALPVLLELYGGASLQPFFNLFCFNNKNAVDKFAEFWNDPGRGIPGTGKGLVVFFRLLVLLSSPQLVSRENVPRSAHDNISGLSLKKCVNDDGQGSNIYSNEHDDNTLSEEEEVDLSWIPSPKSLVELDSEFGILKTIGIGSVTLFGLRVYLAMERYEDAHELATLGLVNSIKPNVKVSCHCALGRISFVQGRQVEAQGHYERAMQMANGSPLSCLSTLVEKDKKHWLNIH